MESQYPVHEQETVAKKLPPLLSPDMWAEAIKHVSLPPRQAQILLLVLQAKKDKEIALAMNLKPSTIRMHLRHMYARLAVTDRMELGLRMSTLLCRKPT